FCLIPVPRCSPTETPVGGEGHGYFGNHVKIPWVQTISRKDLRPSGFENPQRLYARLQSNLDEDTVRTAWRHAEGGRNDRSPSRQDPVHLYYTLALNYGVVCAA